MLIGLLRRQIDDVPATRRLLVSAIILGGNVTVPVGQDGGRQLRSTSRPARRPPRPGCVIAYSSFDQPPPADSLFGRPGPGREQPVRRHGDRPGSRSCAPTRPTWRATRRRRSRPTSPPGRCCVGWAGSAALTPPVVRTPWVTEPQLYSGQCLSAGRCHLAPGERADHAGRHRGPSSARRSDRRGASTWWTSTSRSATWSTWPGRSRPPTSPSAERAASAGEAGQAGRGLGTTGSASSVRPGRRWRRSRGPREAAGSRWRSPGRRRSRRWPGSRSGRTARPPRPPPAVPSECPSSMDDRTIASSRPSWPSTLRRAVNIRSILSSPTARSLR